MFLASCGHMFCAVCEVRLARRTDNTYKKCPNCEDAILYTTIFKK